MESIAGAILIDTKLNLAEVWRIYEPLLSPIVTPDKLELPRLRKLNELCDSLGYFVKDKCIKKEDMVHAELRLQLKDALLIGHGSERSRKAAKGEAARQLLNELEVCWCLSKWLLTNVVQAFPRAEPLCFRVAGQTILIKDHWAKKLITTVVMFTEIICVFADHLNVFHCNDFENHISWCGSGSS